jgi:glycosyltransferase involved in cell wall biosynthesis
VGGATKSGYREALHNGTEIIVKLDGDGQMDPRDIEQLIAPIISGQADFVKGNRFHNWEYAADMPILRKIGNLGLSFLIKLASGYWNIFDPTNGFTAIKASTVSILNLNQLEQGYIFETSQLTELYFLNAQIVQLPMIARYGDGPSSLSIRQSLLEFPPYLFKAMVKRFIRRYIFQDFTAVSVLTIFGSLFLVFGFLFGTYHWIISIALGVPATAGTVMVSAFPMILGIQFLLQALVLDIANTPK